MIFIFIKRKKIKVPKPLLIKIIELAGLKYALGWDLIKNENPEEIFIEICKVGNIGLLEKVIHLVKDINIGLFVAGYFGNTAVSNYLLKRGANNFILNARGEYYHDIRNKKSRIYKPFLIRDLVINGADCKDLVHDLEYNCTHKPYYHAANPCTDCYNLLIQSFLGAAESGNIKILRRVIAMRDVSNHFSKALYLAKKYGHDEVSEKLIDFGAKYPKFVLLDSNDLAYELHLRFSAER
jgi:hypothetical protein